MWWKLFFIREKNEENFLSFCFSTYTVKPAKALLKGQQQIFVVKITPSEVKHYKHDLTFKLNDDEKYNKVYTTSQFIEFRMLKKNQCHIWLCITIWSFIPKVQRIVTVFDFLCSQCVELWGSAESPDVILDTEGVMYFKQTCIGTSTTKQYTIKNVSRIPLR